MAKKPTGTYLSGEIVYRMNRNLLIARAATVLFRVGGAAVFAYCGMESVRALAGHMTFADIVVNVLGGFRINTALAWVLGAGGMVYGRRERSVRMKINERLGGRIKELEESIDRRRTSSRLTKRGQTLPQDSL